MAQPKIIFMGTPPLAATILQALCEKGYNPVAVITQPAKAQGRGHKVMPSAVEQYARTQDLNVMEVGDVNAPMTVDALKSYHPDLILVAAFGQILRIPILNMAKIACLNVHGSLLPKYRGAAPIQRAIMDGETITGITIQKMAMKLDTGDILLQKKTRILPEETSGELMQRMSSLGAEALVEAVQLIESGKYSFVPQDESQATYAKKLDKSESDLDWSKTATQLYNAIRGLQPWPVAQTKIGTENLRIFKAEVLSKKLAPAQTDSDSKTYLHVGTGDGALGLLEVQLENRKRLPIAEFLRGLHEPLPKTLG